MLQRGDLVDGKYRVLRLIGEGGMGAVYEGHNARIDRRVSIKVMHASMTRDRELVARFEREAHAAAKIGSKHIVDVIDLGDLPNGDRFMVMEYLEGETLHARLKRLHRLTPQEVTPLAIQLLEGLAKVHDAGIVHRDLKPANIFLVATADGPDFVKILDFGICKMTRDKGGEVSTGVGNLLGTLPYMCPEQLEHGTKRLDGRADIYSVGVLLYRCVTGRLPYRASNLAALIQLLREGRAPHVCDLEPDIDMAFGEIVDKAIEWDPKARFATARDFQKALVGWTDALARVNRLLTDFLEAPAGEPKTKRPVAGHAVSRITRPRPSKPSLDETKTRRYPGHDRDAQLMDNLHAVDDDVAAEPEEEPPPSIGRSARRGADTKSKKRRGVPTHRMRDAPTIPDDKKRLPSVEVVIDLDGDDAATIPKHGAKKGR